MGFFGRIFHRKKQTPNDPACLREKELERIWVSGWRSSKRLRASSTNDEMICTEKTIETAAPLNDEFCFDQQPSARSIPMASTGSRKPSIRTAQSPSERKTVTYAHPPLRKIPGALLSFPRLQEQVHVLMRDDKKPSAGISSKPLSQKAREKNQDNSIIEPLLPSEVCIQEEQCYNTIVRKSLTTSLAESIVPSLAYSEASSCLSTESGTPSLASTSLTNPSLTSDRSLFNPSCIASYLAKRRARYHRKAAALNPATVNGRRRVEIDSPELGTGQTERALPSVQHANTYVSSSSMSGPYPCITMRSRPRRCGGFTNGTLSHGDYYP